MELLRTRLGLRIRHLRKHRHITQERLAEESGISTDFVSRVERGQNIPSLERIGAIANALNVTLAELFLHIDSSEIDFSSTCESACSKHAAPNKKQRFCGGVRRI